MQLLILGLVLPSVLLVFIGGVPTKQTFFRRNSIDSLDSLSNTDIKKRAAKVSKTTPNVKNNLAFKNYDQKNDVKGVQKSNSNRKNRKSFYDEYRSVVPEEKISRNLNKTVSRDKISKGNIRIARQNKHSIPVDTQSKIKNEKKPIEPPDESELQKTNTKPRVQGYNREGRTFNLMFYMFPKYRINEIPTRTSGFIKPSQSATRPTKTNPVTQVNSITATASSTCSCKTTTPTSAPTKSIPTQSSIGGNRATETIENNITSEIYGHGS
ncbi:hypothetical protein BB560_002218 [Smittium megazygosporum]|uniref:Uncharacterized protein n=1 Tax=Smittium megazygosporum TaxID=133381 RepID=A0A2T9ZFD2_9FUNG|nr:hypothetical protein BB560_002218 [Smittium megazygosporum]